MQSSRVQYPFETGSQLERGRLVETLHWLNGNDIPFVLSYDGQSGNKSYGAPLPREVNAAHLLLHAGRSSQATLSGRDHETIESLYVSKILDSSEVDIFHPKPLQISLFEE